MSLHLLQTKLKYGLMSKKDMEKLKREYSSYSDSERYIIESLLRNRVANFETKNAQLANKEQKKNYKVEDKFRFAFNKTDAVLGLGAIATCAITVAAATLGAPALVPVFAGATVVLAAVGIINEALCYLKARKGEYNMNKIVKFCKHPIKNFRKKLWAKKISKSEKIAEIIKGAEQAKEAAPASAPAQTAQPVQPVKTAEEVTVVDEQATPCNACVNQEAPAMSM